MKRTRNKGGDKKAKKPKSTTLPDNYGRDRQSRTPNPPGNRIPKKSYAIILGYIGKKYFGMQKQLGSGDVAAPPTIEKVLEEALHKAGAISDENFGTLQKIHWSRVARTDKGVHAACQVVGLKLVLPNYEQAKTLTDQENLLIENFKKALEDEAIRIFSLIRVTKTFDARVLCSKRQYEYILPLEVLSRVSRACADQIISEDDSDADLLTLEAAWSYWFDKEDQAPESKSSELRKDESLSPEVPPEAADCETSVDNKDEPTGPNRVNTKTCPLSFYEEKESLPIDVITQFEGVLRKFIGNHKFHNFTSRCSTTSEAGLWRFIENVQVESIDSQLLRIRLIGQSFLLNQIRKMVSLAIEIVKGLAPEKAMNVCLDKRTKCYVHMAPAEGLFLDRVFYTAYNENRANPCEGRPMLTFTNGIIGDKIEGFKQEVIYPTIKGDFNNGEL